MEKVKVFFDGVAIEATKGEKLLEVAKTNGINIPALCFDKRTEMYGGCGLCLVEVKGMPKPVKACTTEAAEGMEIYTATEKVLNARKINLHLLLANHTGDCRPPCVLNCPAGTDCQGYVGLVADGETEKALELIKDKIPIPASIGRVCPHPCEDNCRRGLLDKPIAIAEIKRYAGDMDIFAEEMYMPNIPEESGKNVGIIGGGPYGLSMAYFLRQKGHKVTIFDAMPKAGGMLRYGIPQYRLPKEILDKEISLIEKMGVEFNLGVKIGKDISFEQIKSEFDAVCVGVGAWKSAPIGCKGEEADGVLGGIDFLRKVVLGEKTEIGKRIAVVGGGNTAMDACRTAVRLGAEKVYNIYRRTVEEMPAEEIEIVEAQEEGVIFKNLVNPAEIIADENGRVKAIKLQVMELGEAGTDGRRKPIPVEGKFEMLEVDTAIAAIGQAVEGDLFPEIELTGKKGLKYDKTTYRTNLDGVFAGGDCGNDKISIAIEAIADAEKSSAIVDAYLNGKKIEYRKEFTVERHDLTAESFEDRERMFRQKAHVADKDIRKNNFGEVLSAFTKEQAEEEGKRCLECGCQDYFECKLISYANDMGIDKLRFEGDKSVKDDSPKSKDAIVYSGQAPLQIHISDKPPYIIRDNKKCILCGRCVRTCKELVGASAIDFIKRGFVTVVGTPFDMPLEESGCVSCGQCIAVCPTGALREGRTNGKPIPLKVERIKSICGFCPVGCGIYKEMYGDKLIRIVPDLECTYSGGVICKVGKFGYLDLFKRKDEKLSLDESSTIPVKVIHIKGKTLSEMIASIVVEMGPNVAIGISDNATNEEIAEIKAGCEKFKLRYAAVRDTFKDKEYNFEKNIKLLNIRREKLGLREISEEEIMHGCNTEGIKAAGIEYIDVQYLDIILPHGEWINKSGTITNIDGLKLSF